jgi:cytochrome c oxidase assembly factor CtaG
MSLAGAVLSSWSLTPTLVAGVIAVGVVYVRGWRRLGMPAARLWAMAGGVAALVVAIASPIDALAGLLLSAHMVQHLLLLAIAPLLLLLGAPERALLRGLPPSLLRETIAPLLASRPLVRLWRLLTRPNVAAPVLVAATWAWHWPRAYELALRSPTVHIVEHACFFTAALLFWWPVVHARRPRWSLIPWILFVDIQNSALSALLVFSGDVIYPSYASAPRLFGITAHDDQVTAGAIMWVPGSFAFLGAAILLAARWLSPAMATAERATPPRAAPAAFDLLRVPVAGALLRRGRRVAQLGCFAIAVAVVVDGLRGPRVAPMNLAGVVPWTLWRGLTVLALLAAGNFFCFACPFTLPRALARRLGRARRDWPRALRTKWPAAALLAAFFVAQERLGWWDAPRATACLVLAYFAAAFTVDALMRGASFCKYVCPIGQFHFVTSLVSPLEVKVRLPVVCGSCATHDCVRACALDLNPTRKLGNVDCTFCLDCVTACPHDNLGLVSVTPAHALLDERRLARRWWRADVAVLALVVVLAGFAVAGVMVRATSAVPLVGVGLAVAAALLATGAAALGRTLFCRLSLALVPLGIAMWAGHLLFHLVTGWRALAPVVARFAGVGAPDWSLACAGLPSPALLTFQLLLLDAGLLLSLYAGWRIAGTARRALPFAGFASVLWATGVLIFVEPMQMRGML